MLSLNFLLRIVNFPFSWAQNFTKSMSLTLVSPCPPCSVFFIIFLQFVVTTPFLYISCSLLCCCVTIPYENGFIPGRTGQTSYPMGTSFSMVSKVTCHTNIVRLTEISDQSQVLRTYTNQNLWGAFSIWQWPDKICRQSLPKKLQKY